MAAKPKNSGGLVYSTGQGRMCPDCSQPVAACRCRKAASAVPSKDGVVRVGRQTKGRKGSGVTVINGLTLDAAALQALSARLKKQCGAGGGIKEGAIELQGEHRDTVVQVLQQLGYTVKRVGG